MTKSRRRFETNPRKGRKFVAFFAEFRQNQRNMMNAIQTIKTLILVLALAVFASGLSSCGAAKGAAAGAAGGYMYDRMKKDDDEPGEDKTLKRVGVGGRSGPASARFAKLQPLGKAS